jgi:hypothetical protein
MQQLIFGSWLSIEVVTCRQTQQALQVGVALAEAAHRVSYEQPTAPANTSAPGHLIHLLISQLQSLDLEVYGSRAGCMSSHDTCCTNLHAILRAPVGDGKESMVIVTPSNLTTGRCKDTLMLSCC